MRSDTAAGLVSFTPPPDLARRLDVLPQNYLKARKILERLRLTSNADYANASLKRARDGDELLWPEEVFFTGQHPVMGSGLLTRLLRGRRAEQVEQTHD